MGLDAYNQTKMDPIEKDLAKNLNEKLNLNIRFDDTNNAIRETIMSLNHIQLANYIAKSFQNENGEWIKYPEMKKNKFYPFMVQAGINLLNGKDNKIGSFTTEMTHMHEYMMSNGGIDNVYGPALKNIVEKIQKHRAIKVDGFAGPQFLARMCWYLTGDKNYLDNFNVAGDANYKDKLGVQYYHGSTQENNGNMENNQREQIIIKSLGLTQYTQSINRTQYGIPPNAKVYTRNGHNEGYYYIEGDYLQYNTTNLADSQKLKISSFLKTGNEEREFNNKNVENLSAERKEQEDVLRSINIYGYSHKIAYKINGEWNYCAYSGDQIAAYDKDSKASRNTLSGKATGIYNYIDPIGSNDCNLGDQSYGGIKYIYYNPKYTSTEKIQDIKKYTSKGKRMDKNKEILYNRCRKGPVNNGKGRTGGDFVAFGEQMDRLGVPKRKITFGVWISMLHFLGDKPISSIQNMAIV